MLGCDWSEELGREIGLDCDWLEESGCIARDWLVESGRAPCERSSLVSSQF